MRILIIEDEPLVAQTLEDAVQDAGHEVLGPVASVGAALSLAEQNKPDLVMTNINLGIGGKGVVAAREILQRHQVPSLL
jgi:DNA-binding response OmpR family regulator